MQGGKIMATNLAISIVLFFLAPYLNSAGSLRDNELLVSGGSGETDGLWVTGPNLCIRRGMPGMFFGMVQAPGKDRLIAYTLIIKGDEARKTLAGYDGQCSVVGPIARSEGFVEINGKKVTVDYQMTIDPKGKRAAKEKLMIDGKALDLDAGRVILVDLSGKVATWKQTSVALPANPPVVFETRALEALSRANLEQMRKQNAAVLEFLK
jgi:hypothetical protein